MWEVLPYLKNRILGIHYRSLIFQTQVCRSVLRHEQRTFLKNFEKQRLILKGKQFNTTVTLSRSGQLTNNIPQLRARHINIPGNRNPRVMPKKLKASLAMVNGHVHKPTIMKALNNNGMHIRIARRKPLCSKGNFAAHLQNEKEPSEWWQEWHQLSWLFGRLEKGSLAFYASYTRKMLERIKEM